MVEPKLTVSLSRLPDVAKYVISVAFGCVLILDSILDHIARIPPPRPAVLDDAVALVVVALPLTYLYLMGVVLIYIHVAPPAVAPPPGASSRLAAAARTLASALLLVVAVGAFLLIVVGGEMDAEEGGGVTPT